MKISIKQALYQNAQFYVEQKLTSIQEGIDRAQAEANREGKSSAGNKYETHRAMMHLEIERLTQQLNEAQTLEAELVQIDPQVHRSRVSLGALVETETHHLLIAISVGPVTLDEREYHIISPTSPMAMALWDAEVGDVVQLPRGTMVELLKVE